jgi:hypothetical protein
MANSGLRIQIPHPRVHARETFANIIAGRVEFPGNYSTRFIIIHDIDL